MDWDHLHLALRGIRHLRDHGRSGDDDGLAHWNATHAHGECLGINLPVLVFLAQAANGSVLPAALNDADLRRCSVSLALGTADGDLGAAFSIAGLVGRSGDL